MPRFTGSVDVGDVIVTREGPWVLSAAIRLGELLLGLPAKVNHVVIVHHKDPVTGKWVGIEGRPSGTGWCDVEARLAMPLTNANTLQPKTEEQRYLIARAAGTLIDTAYDWGAIAEAARQATRLRILAAQEWPEDAVPGAVICSSFADWAYERVGLPNPGGAAMTRFTTPAHWDAFMLGRQWA
ncbi:hypothetical protein AB0C10_36535 [Microbispora amethystogenes]|uniref:hypothetical protein n=1 Tax=Microbispora amethystogenes TaxID=1427754 RepID=UPI003406A9D7